VEGNFVSFPVLTRRNRIPIICATICEQFAPFASLKKQAETLFRLICYERKILFRLKKQAEKDGL